MSHWFQIVYDLFVRLVTASFQHNFVQLLINTVHTTSSPDFPLRKCIEMLQQGLKKNPPQTASSSKKRLY